MAYLKDLLSNSANMLVAISKYLLIITISLILIIPAQLYFSDSINDMDNLLLDFKYNFKEFFQKDTIKISKYIVLVDDNDYTREKLGYSPLELNDWTTYLKKLIEFNTKTIALYLPQYFPSKNNDYNLEFKKIVSSKDNIFLPSILGNEIQINTRKSDTLLEKLYTNVEGLESSSPIDYSKVTLPFEEFVDSGLSLGYSNLVPDRDGVIRKIPIISTLQGKPVLSYTLATFINFLEIDVNSLTIKNNSLILHSSKFSKTFQIPLTEKNEMYVHFFKGIEHLLKIPLYNVLTHEGPQNPNFKSHIVINVNTAADGPQKYKTPINPFMPGGMIVAAALNTMVSELYIKPRTHLDRNLSIFFLCLLLVFLAVFFSPNNKLFPLIARNYLFIFFSVIALVIYPIFTCVIFTMTSKELSTALPWILMLTFVFLASAYKLTIEDKERKLLFNTLRGFLPREKIEYLMTPKGADIMLKTRQKDVTILITDIVDFANWCSYHNPNFIFKTLQRYFSALENIIFKHHGTIDKKMGDSLLSFFGDLSDNATHSNDALKAAIEIQECLRKENFPFLTRIGINSGTVMLGNLGTDKHIDYTAIGSTVNMTKRIEDNCIPGGILISSEAYSRILDKDNYEFAQVEIKIKEQEANVVCYNVDLSQS